jgi:hypothetical protein
MRQSGQVVQRLGTLERHMSRMNGSLETFLSRIQIDDRVRVVSDERRITSADQEMDYDITLQPVEIEIDVVDPLAMEEDDASGFLTPVPGTATTTSDSQDDVRMEEIQEGMLAFGTPPLPPPPPPAVNVIPPTPQNSQEVVDHVASSTTPAELTAAAAPSPAAPGPAAPSPAAPSPAAPSPAAPSPAAPGPAAPGPAASGPALHSDAEPDRSGEALAPPDPAPLLAARPPVSRRGRSRTPLPQPVAGPSRLSPAVGLMTRSRSRSLSKSPT